MQRTASTSTSTIDSSSTPPYYVAWHMWQLRAFMTLGQPPEAGALYDAWLANFRRRVSIERRALTFLEKNNLAAAKRAVGPLTARRLQRAGRGNAAPPENSPP
jgi:hypothetical protein